MISLGLCTGWENAALAASLGYDYIEPALNRLAALEEEDFRAACDTVEAGGFPCQAFNCLLPGEIRVTGGAVDPARQADYLARAFQRAARLGAKVIVFGSGGARQVPEGFSHRRAWVQLGEFLARANDAAAPLGLTVVLEPLSREECNILHTVPEATALASLLDLPHLGVLGDTYHMARNGEPLTALAQTGGLLGHLHLANPAGRRFPREGDGVDYEALFALLEEMGYTGRVSVEASTQDLAGDARAALALLDRLRAAKG